MKNAVVITTLILCLFCMTLSTAYGAEMYDYNGTSKPAIEGDQFAGYKYFYLVSSGLLYASDQPATVREETYVGSTSWPHYVPNGTKFAYYTVANNQWEKKTEGVKEGTGASLLLFSISSPSNLVWSSNSVYYENGTKFMNGDPNFFTMAELMNLTVAETMEKQTIPTMVGAMKVLVACGVGCLALLISLKLFGKALFRFLG